MQTHIKKNVLTPSVFSFINDDKKKLFCRPYKHRGKLSYFLVEAYFNILFAQGPGFAKVFCDYD